MIKSSENARKNTFTFGEQLWFDQTLLRICILSVIVKFLI